MKRARLSSEEPGSQRQTQSSTQGENDVNWDEEVYKNNLSEATFPFF